MIQAILEVKVGTQEEDGTQNYLVFKPINRYLKVIANKLYITSWKSKWLSNETIKSPPTSDNILTLLIDYLVNKIRIKFIESFLKQTKLQYTHGAVVNIYLWTGCLWLKRYTNKLFIWCSYFD